VLLDALDAMRAHLDALVLVGAQVVYLRSQGRLAGYRVGSITQALAER
jgi:hypothetical protein